MTMSAPTAREPVKQPRYKRSFKNYLIDSRFQLKYTSFIVLIAVVISAVMGGFLLRTTGEVVAESQKVNDEGQKVVEESKKVSDIVKMNIKDDPSYSDNPELAASFAQASKESDDKIEAQQKSLRDEQQALLRRQDTMLYSLVGGLAAMVLLIGLLGIYFTHKVAGPVYKMKMLLKQVQDGKLRVPPGRLRKGDELQDFFDGFAAMVRELRARQQEEVDELSAAIGAARGAGMSEESLAKISAVRDEMKRALDV
jgi:nitrogen fixation/metabolism regulation signal transduction histidine kinase